MAIMVDQRPKYQGEGKIWDSMREYLPDDIVVYTNREVNGREFDDCLFIKDRGILIIEVKGWRVDQIKVHGVDQIEVSGYEQLQKSPKKQARAYRFALLNKIVDKYNVSPLIFDMVCYPFISEQEYRDSRLDIISENKFTIFKEDLEDREMFQRKLKIAYNSVKAIPHAEFTYDFMLKLRGDWEPELHEQKHNVEKRRDVYSLVSVYPYSLEQNQLSRIIEDYFLGVKTIVFLGDQNSYTLLANEIQKSFQKRNIDGVGNNLRVGFGRGIKIGTTSTRAFNLELYYAAGVDQLLQEPLWIEEGNMDEKCVSIMERLSEQTPFNFQQYQVEHSDPEKNTLVEAGAGTGKTFSMVSRAAFLCNRKNKGIENIAEELAMVTFTNDAANNMRTRLKQMFLNYFILTGSQRYLKFTEEIERAHISTIHSFALDIIRNKSLYTGLGTNFRITSDEYDRKKIYDYYLGDFLKKKEEENPNFARELPVPIYELKNKIMQIADRLMAKSVSLPEIAPEELGTPAENLLPYFNELLLQVVFPAEQEYLQKIHEVNDIDLKECIILLNQILKCIPGKMENLKIRYLFIDEFQDTDDVQIQVFQRLQKAMNAQCRLFIVGDLKQSIYRFRGARLSAFRQLRENSLFEWNNYHLNINYRTDYRLLSRFEPIFSNMGAHKYLPYSEKSDLLYSDLRTDTADDHLLTMVPCHGKDEEAFRDTFVSVLKSEINNVKNLMADKDLSKEERTIAILVRSNWQVEKVVEAAKDSNLQIETHSGGDLFQLPSTLDLYKLLLALNNNDNPLYLVNFMESNYVKMDIDYQKMGNMKSEDLCQKLTGVLDEFFQIRMGKSWRELINDTYTQPILYVVKKIYDALAPWKQSGTYGEQQLHYMVNYEYLLELILRFFRQNTPSLNQLTEYLKINITTGQQQLSRDVGIDAQGVRLVCTTIHKSKGLEYGTVILPFTDEDIADIRKVKLDANYVNNKLSYLVQFENKAREYNTNYSTAEESSEQIAEESRILYVALTRAIRNCVWIKNLDRSPSISWGSLMEE